MKKQEVKVRNVEDEVEEEEEEQEVVEAAHLLRSSALAALSVSLRNLLLSPYCWAKNACQGRCDKISLDS